MRPTLRAGLELLGPYQEVSKFHFLVIYLCEDFTIRNAFILSSWQNEFDPFISTSMSMSLPVSLPEPVSIFIPIHTPPTDYLYLHYLYFNLF